MMGKGRWILELRYKTPSTTTMTHRGIWVKRKKTSIAGSKQYLIREAKMIRFR